MAKRLIEATGKSPRHKTDAPCGDTADVTRWSDCSPGCKTSARERQRRERYELERHQRLERRRDYYGYGRGWGRGWRRRYGR